MQLSNSLSIKKLFLVPAFLLAATISIFAQSKELVISKSNQGYYIEHRVSAKQGLYAIGRLYNVHPRSIASFNGIDMDKGLAIDQLLQIPLTDTNFTQKSAKGTAVYYVAGENEALSKVSTLHNKVSVQNLRTWNKLSKDNVPAGTKLIVGYLVSKELSEAIASRKAAGPAVTEQPKEEKAVVKNEPVREEKVAAPEETKENKPLVKQEAPVTAIVKEKAKTTEIPTTTSSQPVFANDNPATNASGYFKTFYDQQVKARPATKNETVTAGVFKTASGWQDSKYYLLIDGVTTGSIVKIINPETEKAVYAKVLGQMNGIRQNQGLGIRISNAAASALGLADTEKFMVRINY